MNLFAIQPSHVRETMSRARARRRRDRRATPAIEGMERRELLSGTPIQLEYQATAYEADAFGTSVQKILGAATTGEIGVPGVTGALLCRYQGGTIYWSNATGAHVVYGSVADKYASMGGPAGYGLPTSDEATVPGTSGVRITNFDQGRSIVWSAATGPHAVYGAIDSEYMQTANEFDAGGNKVQAILVAATSDEMDVPGVAGARMNSFQGGTIYWSPWTGPHVVYGSIGAEYKALGGPAGYGLPTSDEVNVPGVAGARLNSFWNGGAIYWSGATGAHEVHGAIGAKYAAMGGPAGFGLPTTDEVNVPGVAGARMNSFLNGGAIYWSGATGAHEVHGAIGAEYKALGGPASNLGLPTSDEVNVPGGRANYFQVGKLSWAPNPVSAVGYAPAPAGAPLFNGGGPSDLDVAQGKVGDCWLMASLEEVAARAPQDIKNMFIYDGTTVDNGATVGLYSVRLYANNGFSFYLPVDTELPAGGTYYDRVRGGMGTQTLWVALAEKAYAEASGLGYVTTSNGNQDSYNVLNGGWPSWALHAITGRTAGDYSDPTNAARAWNLGFLVVLTTTSPQSSFIVGDHCYALVGYNASSSQPFTVLNAWGTDSSGWAPGYSGRVYGQFTADATFISHNFNGLSLGAGTKQTTEITRAIDELIELMVRGEPDASSAMITTARRGPSGGSARAGTSI